MDEGMRRDAQDPLFSSSARCLVSSASASSLLSLPSPPLSSLDCSFAIRRLHDGLAEPTLAAAASLRCLSSSLLSIGEEDGGSLDLMEELTALSSSQNLRLLPPAQTTDPFLLFPPETDLDTRGWGINSSPLQSSVPTEKSDETGEVVSTSSSSSSSPSPLAAECRDAELDFLAELITEAEDASPHPLLPPPQQTELLLLPADYLVTALMSEDQAEGEEDNKEREPQGSSSTDLRDIAGRVAETSDDSGNRSACALSSTAASSCRPRAAKRVRARETQEPDGQQEVPAVAPWSSYLAEER